MAPDELKQKIAELLDALPAESLPDVVRFMEFLQYNAGQLPPKRPIRLGGIWEGVSMGDIESDLRKLRREVVEHLEQEFADADLSG